MCSMFPVRMSGLPRAEWLDVTQAVDCVDGAEPGYISRKAVESVLTYQQQPSSAMEQLAALQEQALSMRNYNSLTRASPTGRR